MNEKLLESMLYAVNKGIQAHADLTAKVKSKPGWLANPELIGIDGNLYIPDVMTPSGRWIDLKPNTITGRMEGAAKKALYTRTLRIKGKIIYYDE